MKILVLGSARSKSNYFTATLAKYYNLDYIYEPYRDCFDTFLNKNSKNHFINNLKQVTNQLNERDNFAMKLEVTHLIPDGHYKLLDLNLFNWKNFDKIYTTSRINLSDTVASLTIAQDLNRYFNTKDSTPLPKLIPRQFSISLQNDRIAIMSTLRDRQILKTTQDWLVQNNIGYTEIFYETMDDFVKNNLGNIKQDIWVKNEYNYQTLFSNYAEIKGYIEQFKNTAARQYQFNLPKLS